MIMMVVIVQVCKCQMYLVKKMVQDHKVTDYIIILKTIIMNTENTLIIMYIDLHHLVNLIH